MTKVYLCVGGPIDGQWKQFDGDVMEVAVDSRNPLSQPIDMTKVTATQLNSMRKVTYKKLDFNTPTGYRTFWTPLSWSALNILDALSTNYNKDGLEQWRAYIDKKMELQELQERIEALCLQLDVTVHHDIAKDMRRMLK
jgi:hypothetical protein